MLFLSPLVLTQQKDFGLLGLSLKKWSNQWRDGTIEKKLQEL